MKKEDAINEFHGILSDAIANEDDVVVISAECAKELEKLTQKKAAAQEPLAVKKWLRKGELFGEPKTQADIIEQCGRALDHNNCNDILGDVVFEATDGKHYVITVEAVIQEANAEYVKDILRENEEESEESTETICCEHCGHEYDRHVGDQCPNCGHISKEEAV